MFLLGRVGCTLGGITKSRTRWPEAVLSKALVCDAGCKLREPTKSRDECPEGMLFVLAAKAVTAARAEAVAAMPDAVADC